MAETIPVMTEDKRLEQISEQIVRLANADFGLQVPISEKRDDIDSIIVGLNLLGEELESYIHQLTESEDKLKNALVLLNDAQHLSHIGSWEWIIAENVISWTDELYRIYGRDKENFESSFENFLACIHPDDRDYVNKVIQEAYQDKKQFSFSHRIVRPDGTEAYLDCKGDIYLDENDVIVRMTGTAQDVSDLRKAEEKLRQLAAIVESSSDAIMSKTPDGFLTSWNKQAEQLFGYTEKEALGKHISLLFPAERLYEEDEIIARLRQGHSLINYETERRKKDGTVFSVAITVSPINEPSGKLIAISQIARDITEKKHAEEKLKLYNKILEQKNKETEQFAFIASHDLQEPLRTITNYIGLFSEEYSGKIDETADIYINFIGSASRRMQVLISDLLEYTRAGNDKSLVQVDCNVLLEEITGDLNKAITGSNAEISFKDLPVISGYTTRLKSLFQNLIANAIKFRKPGVSPVITITAKDEGTDWLFEIRDNGIGIEKTYYEKIFMLFQRLHARTEYEGTGLGLAHCKKIVELSGGKIWVESEQGKGSSFFFTLPKKFAL